MRRVKGLAGLEKGVSASWDSEMPCEKRLAKEARGKEFQNLNDIIGPENPELVLYGTDIQGLASSHAKETIIYAHSK